jgi:uncharacterized protein (TIGR03437 family)
MRYSRHVIIRCFMRYLSAILLCFVPQLFGATFGTVVAPTVGSAYSDVVLDEARTRLYLVNTTLNRIDIYNYRTRAFLAPITTDTQPVSAALSRDGRFLYVTAYQPPILDIIDLNLGQIPVNGRIPMPANPEGVAVGADGRVLITAIPSVGNTNSLLIYDPAPNAANPIANVPVVPPAATPPVLPVPSGRIYNSYRSRLLATPDGKWIIGLNGLAANMKTVFVYETVSGTVLRSRTVTNLSTALSVNADATKFMAGGTLFDGRTLQVIAQENTANAPFTFFGAQNGTAVFNAQQNQGGSVFAPDGSAIYAAFNTAPLLAARPNITELMVNDPDNLLITMGLQMPENLAGKMVIESTGANVYAISDSGFIILPVSTIAQSPLAVPQNLSVLLTNDLCGVFKGITAVDNFDNAGRGRFTVNLTALPNFGAIGGPGQPPQPAVNVPAPTLTVSNTGATPAVTFRYNAANAISPGTAGPVNYIVSSPEAINIPATIHVYQNNRDSITVGTVVPVGIGATTTEGLTDILLDNARQRIYIANSGLNRLEVFDIKTQKFLNPIKVGQLPHQMALGMDGITLYVANTGGESVSIVDLVKGVQTGRVVFPAFPFNASVGITNPVAIVVTGRGPQFITSDGVWWKIDSTGQAIPRTLNASIFGVARGIPGGNPALWSMAATPGGEFVLVVNGGGVGFLYDYTVDDFVLTKQVLQGIAGYIGPLTAGPQGRYYSVGGTILNASLTPVQGSTNGLSANNRLVPAVAAISASQVALFTLPARANGNVAVPDAGLVELYDPTTGLITGNGATLEGPAATANGMGRITTFSRMLAYDATASTAYILTTTGLSIVKVNQGAAPAVLRPTVNAGGVVSAADNSANLAPGEIFAIMGRNFGTSQTATPPLPNLLGGLCVTLNNQLIPLNMTSASQINAQIPVTLAAGRYPLVIRSIDNSAISVPTTVTVSKYAPAVVVSSDGQAAIMHKNGQLVNQSKPAQRDETLTIYALGMGVTHGGAVITGNVAPASPLAVTDAVQVFFGNPLYRQSAMIVRSSTLVPGMIGVAQITITVPGFHEKGSALPVTVKIGGVSSSATGALAPHVSVN